MTRISPLFPLKLYKSSSGFSAISPKAMENTENLNRDPKGYYAMLGVSPDATEAELFEAFRRKMEIYGMMGDHYTCDMIKRIFWQTLHGTETRSAYDRGYKLPSNETFTPARKPYMYINVGGLPGCETPPPKSWWGKLFD